jgi:hypothetical protein
MTKRSKQEIIGELKRLDNEIGIMNEREKLLKSKCKICGNLGCDILSFKYRGPAHSTCIMGRLPLLLEEPEPIPG